MFIKKEIFQIKKKLEQITDTNSSVWNNPFPDLFQWFCGKK